MLNLSKKRDRKKAEVLSDIFYFECVFICSLESCKRTIWEALHVHYFLSRTWLRFCFNFHLEKQLPLLMKNIMSRCADSLGLKTSDILLYVSCLWVELTTRHIFIITIGLQCTLFAFCIVLCSSKSLIAWPNPNIINYIILASIVA